MRLSFIRGRLFRLTPAVWGATDIHRCRGPFLYAVSELVATAASGATWRGAAAKRGASRETNNSPKLSFGRGKSHSAASGRMSLLALLLLPSSWSSSDAQFEVFSPSALSEPSRSSR